ncbi:tyrosine-type recombinase/integrase [Aureibacter tunicatorum]|uniref:tyrosine-type recombinase/integrase n=1 Tax=Aureibacter tunicatorum TaxID=866807 RepID=UPI0035B52E7F
MYSSSSIQKIVKKYVRESGVNKTISTHSLRHNLATHLLKNAVILRYIKHILRHRNSKTTEIHTYITNFRHNNINNLINIFEILFFMLIF